jgi:hypothetical protein
MANVEGYITVYESSDGGTGDPAKTVWQFFVGIQPVNTENRWITETMQLAINTSSKVQVTYNQEKGNVISQARIEFKYLCESHEIQECNVPSPEMKVICETRRYTPCKPSDISHDDNKHQTV